MGVCMARDCGRNVILALLYGSPIVLITTMESAISKLTSKGQATIPSVVRERLKIGAGDRIAFTMHKDRVEISRAEPIDVEFIRAQEAGLTREWLSAEDDAAYGSL